MRRVSSECLADRSRYFFARRWRLWRALNLLAGRSCPRGLGCRLVYQAMRAFWRAAISEEHANCVSEIILWCHCTGSLGHHSDLTRLILTNNGTGRRALVRTKRVPSGYPPSPDTPGRSAIRKEAVSPDGLFLISPSPRFPLFPILAGATRSCPPLRFFFVAGLWQRVAATDV